MTQNRVISNIFNIRNLFRISVLTWCQMSKIPAVAYVCFSSSFVTDSSSVKPYVQLVSKFPFKLLKEKPDFTCTSYKGHEVASNVYM